MSLSDAELCWQSEEAHLSNGIMGIDHALISRLKMRRTATAAIRRFFENRSFLEVDTAMLCVGGGLEPHIDPLPVSVRLRPDLPAESRVLHTSPELAMKRLLAAGTGDIFQLCRVFRDGERTPLHLPEFTLLEWYRVDAELDTIAHDCIELFALVAKALEARVAWTENPPLVLTVEQAFSQYAKIDLRAVLHGDAAHQSAAMVDGARNNTISLREGADFDDAFFAVMEKYVEPSLPQDRMTILGKWPARMAALAKLATDDPLYANRFEIYARGLELANAFDELDDPAEQRLRFQRDNALRVAMGKSRLSIDEQFLADLAEMPSAAGVAVGFERMLMAICGRETIDDVWGLRWS